MHWSVIPLAHRRPMKPMKPIEERQFVLKNRTGFL
jgi:hypothetical protein